MTIVATHYHLCNNSSNNYNKASQYHFDSYDHG